MIIFPQPKRPDGPMTWDMMQRRDWGNHISWLNADSLLVCGHTQPRPQIGDFLLAPTRNGKTAKCRFTDVELRRDPPDLWFGRVEFLEYLDTNKEQTAKS